MTGASATIGRQNPQLHGRSRQRSSPLRLRAEHHHHRMRLLCVLASVWCIGVSAAAAATTVNGDRRRPGYASHDAAVHETGRRTRPRASLVWYAVYAMRKCACFATRARIHRIRVLVKYVLYIINGCRRCLWPCVCVQCSHFCPLYSKRAGFRKTTLMTNVHTQVVSHSYMFIGCSLLWSCVVAAIVRRLLRQSNGLINCATRRRHEILYIKASHFHFACRALFTDHNIILCLP